jgi:uncharacterized RDD family membrane protein YckC
VPASLARRIMSLAYEALLLSAVLLAGTLPFVLLFRDADPMAARPLLQLYLVAIAGLYFGWQWLRGGQTLPMKTWRLKLVARGGGPLTKAHVLRRILFGLAGTITMGAGFFWALVDADRQFLHDRLAGTVIVNSEH